MKIYDFIAIFLIPITLINFIIDYLSDENITKDETKIGFLQLLHHLICLICFISPFISLFVLKDLNYTLLSIILLIIVQVGFLINKDRCWYTHMVNKLKGISVNMRWINDIPSFIKYYIRGNEWAHGDINPDFNHKYSMPVINICYILILMKFIKF